MSFGIPSIILNSSLPPDSSLLFSMHIQLITAILFSPFLPALVLSFCFPPTTHPWNNNNNNHVTTNVYKQQVNNDNNCLQERVDDWPEPSPVFVELGLRKDQYFSEIEPQPNI